MGKMLDVLTAENQQLRSNGDLRRVSVPCEGNRKGRKAYCGLVRMWSSLWLKGDGGIRKKTPHLFSDEEHFLELEVDFLQPFLDIEARTALANPGEVTMT